MYVFTNIQNNRTNLKCLKTFRYSEFHMFMRSCDLIIEQSGSSTVKYALSGHIIKSDIVGYYQTLSQSSLKN